MIKLPESIKKKIIRNNNVLILAFVLILFLIIIVEICAGIIIEVMLGNVILLEILGVCSLICLRYNRAIIADKYELKICKVVSKKRKHFLTEPVYYVYTEEDKFMVQCFEFSDYCVGDKILRVIVNNKKWYYTEKFLNNRFA